MSEVRQRWRLVFSRGEEARYLSHLDAVKLWERAFRRGSIPVATTEGFNPRPRLIFAAPLQLGMLGEHELADLYLSERLTLPDIRARLERCLPLGYGLVEVHDEWVGAPALATQLVAADYRLTLLGVPRDELEHAIDRLLGAARLDRERRRETKAVAYDLRPLLVDVRVVQGPDAARGSGDATGTELGEAPSRGVGLWLRLRHSQDQGSGRVEEVVAALDEERQAAGRGAESGASSRPEIVLPVRERLWLAGEIPIETLPTGASPTSEEPSDPRTAARSNGETPAPRHGTRRGEPQHGGQRSARRGRRPAAGSSEGGHSV